MELGLVGFEMDDWLAGELQNQTPVLFLELTAEDGGTPEAPRTTGSGSAPCATSAAL